ncbi:unnamed protein product [Didymodactylos carnosus]|uniref:Uncharacterized protein n=1 Tax=Didymodactylos carnosus TaxID=1234261 RepID=A0A814U6E2_9BILA|nr:unnamed protein product [Didymodactylos carnosus]CAF3934206.1 unnamed protein product [Didymodactylos carnosus]
MIKVVYILLSILKFFTLNDDSIVITIRKRYGRGVLQTFRQLEKLKIKQVRVEQGIEFIRICLLYDASPKFVRFKAYNKQFHDSNKYRELSRSILYDSYQVKKKEFETIKRLVASKDNELKVIIGSVTYVKISSHISYIVEREKKLLRMHHKNKLVDLTIPVDKSEFKQKLVYNYSHRALTKGEESLLSHGWKYAINTKPLSPLNVKADIEYMYHCMERNSLINKSNISKVKSILHEFGNNIIKKQRSNIPNLSNEEIQAIKTLLNDKSLVISKVDKGNAVVVLNKEDYLEKGHSLLADQRLFRVLDDNPTEEREKQFIAFLLKLKNKKNDHKR